MACPAMKAETMQLALEREKNNKLEKQVSALKRQLVQTVQSMERLRSAKRPRFAKLPARRPRLRGDKIRVCIPDTHGARIAHKALAAALSDIKALAPDEVILLGDHADCGGFLAQHHTLGYVAETDYSYEEDIAAANGFLDAVQIVAPKARIEYLEGNHERRVETWCVTETLRHARDGEMLRRAFAPEFLLHLEQRGISYYRLSECYDGLDIPGVIKRGNCYFFHGITTAKHAAFVTRMRTAGNCVFGHIHRAQNDIGRSLNVGVCGVWSPGCLCELQPLWNHGSPTDWTHGIAWQFISRTGKFLHLNVPIIDGQSLFTSLLKN